MTLIPHLDTSNLSKELKLQLKLMHTENVEDTDWFTEIDWEEFYDLLLHHRTFSFLYGKVKHLDHVPQDIRQRLERMYKHFTFEMMHLTREMATINSIFQDYGVRTLFLKGPVLAKELYGDLSLRTSNDLDVLVSIYDLDRVDERLTKEGYVKDDYIRSILGDWKWRHHHIAYYHPEKNIKLEIHWRLNPGPWKEPTFDELWSRRKACSLTQKPLYMLGNEDLFLYLISHGARHGWSRARWLLDISFLLEKKLDMIILKRLFKKHHADQLAGQTLHLLNTLFRIPVSDELKMYTRNNHGAKIAQQTLFYFQNKINLHTDPVPDWVSSYHEKYLFNLKNKVQQIYFMLSFFYPYPEDMDVIPLPKPFHFLYFPLRPFIVIWKKMRIKAELLQKQ